MKNLFYLLLLFGILFSCENVEPESTNCDFAGTIKDLSELDGCGYVIELDNGTILEPIRRFWCGTGLTEEQLAQMEKENTFWNFPIKDGLRVTVGYELAEDFGSICMAGEGAMITCIDYLNKLSDSR